MDETFKIFQPMKTKTDDSQDKLTYPIPYAQTEAFLL